MTLLLPRPDPATEDAAVVENPTAPALNVTAKVPASESESAEPDFQAIAVRSILLTTLVMFLGVGLPMWALTGEPWDGIGLGAFCAFWGGPGFGVMVAGVRWTALTEAQTQAQTQRGH